MIAPGTTFDEALALVEQLAYELRRIRPWVKQNFHTYAERRDYFRERVRRALA